MTHEPLTREELVRKLAARWRIQKRPAAERLDAILDAVLDEVLAMAAPRLEHDFSGSVVLQTLQRWRGHRPSPESRSVAVSVPPLNERTSGNGEVAGLECDAKDGHHTQSRRNGR